MIADVLLRAALNDCGPSVWESNSQAQAVTPHVCSGGAAAGGSYKCQGKECGDDDKGERDLSVCDKSGCDFNPYRLGVTDFYGNSSSYSVDTTKPFTVVTQWITSDNTDTGDLVEIRRKYVQNGKVCKFAPRRLVRISFQSNFRGLRSLCVSITIVLLTCRCLKIRTLPFWESSTTL